MASRVSQIGEGFTFVDAGAGTGMLTAALCDRIGSISTPRRITAWLYETDPNVRPVLQQTLRECRAALAAAGHHLDATVLEEDFVLHRPGAPLFAPASRSEYADVVIMNPPYAKLEKDSPQARAFAEIVHGQPNAYALFMAAAVDLLRPGGELVAITPRSFCNGLYFREFRRWLLARMSLRHIHVFESRRAAFKDAQVLQENIITTAVKQTERTPEVMLSVSHGAEMDHAKWSSCAAATMIDDSAGHSVIRLPTASSDFAVMRAIESWSDSFDERGLRISTGPVVAFRAAEYLLDSAEHPDAVPLISMHNIRPFVTAWPVAKGTKPVALRASHGAASLVLPARNYVLLRRFSSKEERRRLIASPYLPNAEERRRPVALENHVNYVTHTSRELTEDEVRGLVALFNSDLFDRYFRVVSGSTQVNATDIRVMPFPDLQSVSRVGKRVAEIACSDRDAIDSCVRTSLGVLSPPSHVPSEARA